MKNTTEYWKAEADRLFSLWIRQRFASGEIVQCATCTVAGEWRYMDCGHFMSRKHNSTRCHEHNAMAQCPSCNRGDGRGNHANGEQYLMGKALDIEFGEGTADSMVFLSKQSIKMSWSDWKELAEKYKGLLREKKLLIR